MSYPHHYHISQIAIKHAIKHIPDITEVAIIWDDTHAVKPSAPLNEMLQLQLPCYTYPWSSIVDRPNIKGWLGQQIIKLHLDNVIKNECVILDGDLILNQDVDPKNITYGSLLPRNHPRYDHISEMLGLGVYEYTSCPFMYVKSFWLKKIREFGSLYSNMDFIDRFVLAHQTSHTLTEWALIGTYIFDVLKLPRRREHFHRRAVKPNSFASEFNQYENFVLDGPDDIGVPFLTANGVLIDTQLMRQLGYCTIDK